jgi:hypothetical protein
MERYDAIIELADWLWLTWCHRLGHHGIAEAERGMYNGIIGLAQIQ